MTPEKEAFYKKAKEIKKLFTAKYWPRDPENNPFGINMVGIGGEYYDCESNTTLVILRVGVLNRKSKNHLVKELCKNAQSTKDKLRFNEAMVEIDVIGPISALATEA